MLVSRDGCLTARSGGEGRARDEEVTDVADCRFAGISGRQRHCGYRQLAVF
jgi:hypothetical protein